MPTVTSATSGHADHTGPVWDATLKADHIKWGDIIPPFKFDGGTFPGLNWNDAGKAIDATDCVPAPPPVPEPAVAAAVVAVSPQFTG